MLPINMPVKKLKLMLHPYSRNSFHSSVFCGQIGVWSTKAVMPLIPSTAAMAKTTTANSHTNKVRRCDLNSANPKGSGKAIDTKRRYSKGRS